MPELMAGLAELLPARAGDRDGSASGRVFKIELTPPVLLAALDRAGTVVCEPMTRVSLEIPADAVGSVLACAKPCSNTSTR